MAKHVIYLCDDTTKLIPSSLSAKKVNGQPGKKAIYVKDNNQEKMFALEYDTENWTPLQVLNDVIENEIIPQAADFEGLDNEKTVKLLEVIETLLETAPEDVAEEATEEVLDIVEDVVSEETTEEVVEQETTETEETTEEVVEEEEEEVNLSKTKKKKNFSETIIIKDETTEQEPVVETINENPKSITIDIDIIPLGEFYYQNEKVNYTAEDLKKIVENFYIYKSFGGDIPIYMEHPEATDEYVKNIVGFVEGITFIEEKGITGYAVINDDLIIDKIEKQLITKISAGIYDDVDFTLADGTKISGEFLEHVALTAFPVFQAQTPINVAYKLYSNFKKLLGKNKVSLEPKLLSNKVGNIGIRKVDNIYKNNLDLLMKNNKITLSMYNVFLNTKSEDLINDVNHMVKQLNYSDIRENNKALLSNKINSKVKYNVGDSEYIKRLYSANIDKLKKYGITEKSLSNKNTLERILLCDDIETNV